MISVYISTIIVLAVCDRSVNNLYKLCLVYTYLHFYIFTHINTYTYIYIIYIHIYTNKIYYIKLQSGPSLFIYIKNYPIKP